MVEARKKFGDNAAAQAAVSQGGVLECFVPVWGSRDDTGASAKVRIGENTAMEQLLSEALAEFDFETTVEKVSCGVVHYPVNGACAELAYQQHMARNQSDQIGPTSACCPRSDAGGVMQDTGVASATVEDASFIVVRTTIYRGFELPSF